MVAWVAHILHFDHKSLMNMKQYELKDWYDEALRIYEIQEQSANQRIQSISNVSKSQGQPIGSRSLLDFK